MTYSAGSAAPGRAVALVVTGGTAGSTVRSGVAELDAEAGDRLTKWAQEAAAELGVSLEIHRPFSLHSEQMGPMHWQRLADLVAAVAERVRGVVVVHGTDTAAYTSAALAYLSADLDVPIVITGAAAPRGGPGTDARRNLRGALAAAAFSLPGGSYLAFADSEDSVAVHLGTRVRKVVGGTSTFLSVGRAPVAAIRDLAVDAGPMAPTMPLRGTRRELDDRVQVIGCHPGQRLVSLFDWAGAGGMAGIVVHLYPSRTAPVGDDEYGLDRAVRRAVDAGLVVACTAGGGTPGQARYPSNVALADSGAILLEALPVEAALPKLMWALKQGDDPEAVRRCLVTSVRGDLDSG